MCALLSVQAKEGQHSDRPLRSAYGRSLCAHACRRGKVSGVFRQGLLILQGSLESTGGRIRIHLAVLSGGRRDIINNNRGEVTGPVLQPKENSGGTINITHRSILSHLHTRKGSYTHVHLKYT